MQAAVARLFGVNYHYNVLNSTGAYRITDVRTYNGVCIIAFTLYVAGCSRG